jgi:hypothetical protein
MRIVPSTSLSPTNRLTVFGFPFGTQIADDLFQGLGVRDLAVTLQTRTTTVSDKVHDTDQNLKYIQYEGGADEGNDGSAVVDSEGNVRCVHVGGIADPRIRGQSTQLKMGIPSEYALRMLQGFPLEIETPYAYLDGSTARQPIEVLFADPVRRVTRAGVDVWVGSGGKPRKPAESLPKAAPGDSVRQTFDLQLEPDSSGLFMKAVGEFPLPPRSPGQVYWLQPRFVNATTKEQWGRAVPFSPDGPPVDRRTVALEHKLPPDGTERTLELTSEALFHWQRFDQFHTEGQPLKAVITEKVLKPRRGTSYVQMSYKDLIWDLPIRTGSPTIDSEIRRLLKQFTDLIKGVVTIMTVTKEGVLKTPQTDYSGVPLGGLFFTKSFNDQLMQSLTAMSIRFPNRQVKYLDTWDQPTNLFIETRSRYEPALFDMKFKYLGVRDHGGRLEAVVELDGTLTKDEKKKPIDEKELKAGKVVDGASDSTDAEAKTDAEQANAKKTRGVYGLAKGHAYIDVNGGYVAEVQLFIDVDVVMKVKDPDTKAEVPTPAGGTMEVLFKRLTNIGSR